MSGSGRRESVVLPPIGVSSSTKYCFLIFLLFILGSFRVKGCAANWEWKDGGMLELTDKNQTNAKDKDSEFSRRKKAKLVKKLKEQEGLVNANKQVMVRDRRRPRKSIKEMSVLNKRRRVIKNTARKEITQQKATLESMRHIELKRYSLEARELELFVERIRKVKENKRLTMLFAKFKVTSDSDDSDGSLSPVSDEQQQDSSTTSAQVDVDQSSDSTNDNKKTESMAKLIDELNRMSMIIDYEANPQWKYIIQGSDQKEKGTVAKKEPEPDLKSPSPVDQNSSAPILFGSRFTRNQASEAPAELQSINRFPSINNGKASSKDDSELTGYFSSVKRCLSQPAIIDSNGHPSRPVLQSIKTKELPLSDTIPSMPTLCSDVEVSTRETTEDAKLPTTDQLSPGSGVESHGKVAYDYHSNWRDREKRGDPLYSPVALSPIQSGLFSPDFVMDEDDRTANYRRKLNPKRFQTGVSNNSGDMEFNQAMTKITSDPKPKKVGYSGTQSIIEMQLNSKTKHITDKVQKVRAETMKEKAKSKTPKNQATKNIAQMIHQAGDGSRFVEEVKVLRQFAVLCNCKYLRTDPERLDDRRQAYINTLMDNVTKRVQIRNKWKMGLRKASIASCQQPTIALPVIAQGSAE